MENQRIALGLSYDGSAYHGWQSQQGISTVQQRLEAALTRVANHDIVLTCAGRTDAGVHATGQVVHFDSDANRTEYSWVFGANANLSHDIRVNWAKIVSPTFHSRFSAVRRRYRYVVFNHSIRPGILRNAVGWCYQPLDVSLMQHGSRYLIGEHDFSAFRGAGCQSSSPVRQIYSLDITRNQYMIVIDITANAFLLHMVRNIVGVLMAVGCGDQAPESGPRQTGGARGQVEEVVRHELRANLARSCPAVGSLRSAGSASGCQPMPTVACPKFPSARARP